MSDKVFTTLGINYCNKTETLPVKDTKKALKAKREKTIIDIYILFVASDSFEH